MMNNRDIPYFVPANAENFRGTSKESNRYLNAHLVNMHIFAMRTLQNSDNFNRPHIAMAARTRLTRSIGQLMNTYDYFKPISEQPGLKAIVHQLAESTNGEPGLMGIGQWFARVMGNVNVEIAPILGRIAVSAIVAKGSHLAQSEPAAVGSFVRGIANELPNLTSQEVGHAYEASLKYLYLMERRHSGNDMGTACANYRGWLEERVGEMDLQLSSLTLGNIQREVRAEALG